MSRGSSACIGRLKAQRFMRCGADWTGRDRERGQSLVELALAMLILPILLAGVINFGLAFLNWIAMRDAAQEGAAYGSYAPTDEQGIIARARETLEGTQAGEATITVVVTQACSSNPIRVDVDADFPVLVPFLNALTPPTLHASATDTILRPKCGP